MANSRSEGSAVPERGTSFRPSIRINRPDRWLPIFRDGPGIGLEGDTPPSA